MEELIGSVCSRISTIFMRISCSSYGHSIDPGAKPIIHLK
jgi:hypothetical protein